MTCESFRPSTLLPQDAETSTSSAAASPARTSVLQAGAQDLPASDPASGQSSPGSLARYDRATQSWRTSQLCLDGDWDRFSETWPRSGMMRSGIAFPLRPLAHPTSATASGSWPTPTADAGLDGIMSPTYAERFHRKGRSGSFIEAMSGRIWPTPTAEDGESKGMSAKRREEGRKPDSLCEVVRFPSPAARDWRSGKGRSENGHTPQLPEVVSGQLNPTWVEWLLGLPLKWTDVSGSSD